jgi:V/A-type H+-transporting ATPase subunit A
MVDAIISRISGPVVVAKDVEGARMFDVVRIGEMGLVGEIIHLEGNNAQIQVYEDTTGLKPGEKVVNTNRPLSLQLGPGLLKSIYDGIQRPLDILAAKRVVGLYLPLFLLALDLWYPHKLEFVRCFPLDE